MVYILNASSILQAGIGMENAKGKGQKKKGNTEWKASLTMQEFPTNAYGQIQFDGNVAKAAKYVRLADNTTMANVKDFINEYWDLMKPRPHLALSIVGGAKNFKMDGRKRGNIQSRSHRSCSRNQCMGSLRWHKYRGHETCRRGYP